jgi:hypothetical protein
MGSKIAFQASRQNEEGQLNPNSGKAKRFRRQIRNNSSAFLLSPLTYTSSGPLLVVH